MIWSDSLWPNTRGIVRKNSARVAARVRGARIFRDLGRYCQWCLNSITPTTRLNPRTIARKIMGAAPFLRSGFEHRVLARMISMLAELQPVSRREVFQVVNSRVLAWLGCLCLDVPRGSGVTWDGTWARRGRNGSLLTGGLEWALRGGGS